MSTNTTAVDVFGLPFVYDNFGTELWTIGKYTGVAAVGQLMALLAAPKENRLTTANLLLWLPIGPIYCYWVTMEVLTNYINSTIEERKMNLAPAGLTATRTYICLQCVGLVVELIEMFRKKRSEWASQLPIIGHHIMSAMGCTTVLYYRRFISCAVCLQLVEMSTIFLNLLLFSKNPAYKPWVHKNVPWLTTFSGVLLWVTFLVFRLTVCPLVILQYILDQSSGHPIVSDSTWFEVFLLLSSGLTVWVLSMIWFKKIHKGFMKEIKKVFFSKKNETETIKVE